MKRPQRRPHEDGYTLIELLLVVAIISILSAIAAPQLLGAREKAKHSACLDAFHAVDSALISRMEELERTGDLHAAQSAIDQVVARAILDGARNPRNLNEPGYVVSSLPVPTIDKTCQVFVSDESTLTPSITPAIVVAQYEGTIRTFRITLN